MLTIQIDQRDLARVQTKLSGIKNGAATVMMRALNKTLTGAKTDASKIMRDEVTAKKKDLDSHIGPRKASVADLTASLAFDHKPIPLSQYQHRVDPLGMRSKVWKRKGETFHPHAFGASMKSSSHEGVFRRTYRAGAGAGTWKARLYGAWIPWGRLPKKYRLPIKQLYGPTAKNLMADVTTPLLPKVGALATDRLRSNLSHELEYLLSKA